MVSIGKKLYLKENPLSLGGFLPAGEKEITKIKKIDNMTWVMIKGYNDWINIKWFYGINESIR
jgi:hypothetical protein